MTIREYNECVNEHADGLFRFIVKNLNDEFEAEKQEYNNVMDYVNKVIHTLPKQQKSAILLRDYEGYDYNSIGKITGMSESQVKVNIHRARKKIKAFISKLELLIV